MSGVIKRGKIIRADLANYDGRNTTYSRPDATGGTISGVPVGNDVDVLSVYGGGTARNDATIRAALGYIGAGVARLSFAPGTWTIDESVTIPATLPCHVAAGCVFNVASGKTLTFSGKVDVDYQTLWKSGAGTVVADLTVDNIYFFIGDYGAVGDGSTNDTTAFQLAAAAINAAGGGTLWLEPGKTYIVGRQSLAGSSGQGGSWLEEAIFTIANCTRPVIVEGNGAIIKLAGGLRFGSFDPVTGDPYTPPALPFTNASYRADPGVMLWFTPNNHSVIVKNVELDGNLANLIVGGKWGDSGYQVAAYGIISKGNKNSYFENVYSHHHGTNGIGVSYAGLSATSEKTPATLVNCRCEYNGRLGVAWTGGIGFTATNCIFSHSGKAVNTGLGGVLASSPGAGFDIEAEGSVCRDGVFESCEFVNNTGAGMVADSGDSSHVSFHNCLFWGTTNTPVWPDKPYYSFYDCRIYGSVVQVYPSTAALDRTEGTDAVQFHRCTFEDKPWSDGNVYGKDELTKYLVIATPGNSGVYKNCNFINNTMRLAYLIDAVIDGCVFENKNSSIPDTSWVMVVWGSLLRNVTVIDSTASPPATYHYVSESGDERFEGYNVTVGSKMLWNPGYSGERGSSFTGRGAFSFNRVGLTRNMLSSLKDGSIQQWADDAVPASGTFAVGDWVINQDPGYGKITQWKCSVAGNPGTWLPENVIPSVSADKGNAAATLTAGTSDTTNVWNTVITADREVTLSTTGVWKGAKLRVIRTAAATGAFNLNVGTGPLKALAAGQWCDVEYDGSAWILTGFGSL